MEEFVIDNELIFVFPIFDREGPYVKRVLMIERECRHKRLLYV